MKGGNGKRYEKQRQIEGAHDKPKRAEMRQLEDELEKMRQELEREANAEASGTSLQETVGVFAPHWLEHTAMTGKTRKHVVEKRLHHLQHFILPLIGDKELCALRRSDLAAWMQSVAMLRQPNGKLYGRVTLLGAWATLRAMLRRAVICATSSVTPRQACRSTSVSTWAARAGPCASRRAPMCAP